MTNIFTMTMQLPQSDRSLDLTEHNGCCLTNLIFIDITKMLTETVKKKNTLSKFKALQIT